VSLLLAGLALFIVLGGSAVAASGLINGKKIKKGTITAKQIKNKTITTGKLAPATVASLKGKPGAQGPAGRTGTTGPAGADGTDGVVAPFYAEDNEMTLPDDSVLLSLDVPAGDYMLSAKANVTSNQNGVQVTCAIWTDEVAAVDESTADPVDFNETVPLSMEAVTEVEGLVELKCNSYDFPGSARSVKLTALPIG
jgi:hypothetical protein